MSNVIMANGQIKSAILVIPQAWVIGQKIAIDIPMYENTIIDTLVFSIDLDYVNTSAPGIDIDTIPEQMTVKITIGNEILYQDVRCDVLQDWATYLYGRPPFQQLIPESASVSGTVRTQVMIPFRMNSTMRAIIDNFGLPRGMAKNMKVEIQLPAADAITNTTLAFNAVTGGVLMVENHTGVMGYPILRQRYKDFTATGVADLPTDKMLGILSKTLLKIDNADIGTIQVKDDTVLIYDTSFDAVKLDNMFFFRPQWRDNNTFDEDQLGNLVFNDFGVVDYDPENDLILNAFKAKDAEDLQITPDITRVGVLQFIHLQIMRVGQP